MSEIIIAAGITAKCADGSVHPEVTMKIVDDVVIYETSDGQHLCGDCCVKFMDDAKVFVSAGMFGAAVLRYRNQEA